MPEPNQPVDQWAVSRPVPLNSSSNLSVQSPGTPVGIGVGPAELAGVGPAELAGVGPAELAGVGPAELACSRRSAVMTAAAAITRMVAASNHDPRPPVNSLSLSCWPLGAVGELTQLPVRSAAFAVRSRPSAVPPPAAAGSGSRRHLPGGAAPRQPSPPVPRGRPDGIRSGFPSPRREDRSVRPLSPRRSASVSSCQRAFRCAAPVNLARSAGWRQGGDDLVSPEQCRTRVRYKQVILPVSCGLRAAVRRSSRRDRRLPADRNPCRRSLPWPPACCREVARFSRQG